MYTVTRLISVVFLWPRFASSRQVIIVWPFKNYRSIIMKFFIFHHLCPQSLPMKGLKTVFAVAQFAIIACYVKDCYLPASSESLINQLFSTCVNAKWRTQHFCWHLRNAKQRYVFSACESVASKTKMWLWSPNLRWNWQCSGRPFSVCTSVRDAFYLLDWPLMWYSLMVKHVQRLCQQSSQPSFVVKCSRIRTFNFPIRCISTSCIKYCVSNT